MDEKLAYKKQKVSTNYQNSTDRIQTKYESRATNPFEFSNVVLIFKYYFSLIYML